MNDLLYIVDQPALNDFCAGLRGVSWLALDTEFIREQTYYPQLCLIQIASADRVACIDPLALPSLDPLLDLVGGRSGWAASVVLFLALPALGLLAVWLAERASVLYHSYRAVTTTVNRRGQIAGLRERRRALRQLVEDGVAGTDAGPA